MSSLSFTLRGFFNDAGWLLVAPGQFFSRHPGPADWRRAAGLFSAAAILASSLSLMFVRSGAPLFGMGIFVFNALGIVMISTLFGFLVLQIIPGVSLSFPRLLCFYAYAGSWPLLLSCIPGAALLSEIWKWWLVGIGLTRSGVLLWWQALIVVAGSLGLTTLLLFCLILLSQ